MPTPAYVFSTLDDEPIVPSLSDFNTKSARSSSIMDHQNTSTTLRTSAKKPIAEDELEELQLNTFSDSKKSREFEVEQVEEEAQTLNKRDYGNFALLVVLCKSFITNQK
jgi:hypothetical protein